MFTLVRNCVPVIFYLKSLVPGYLAVLFESGYVA